MLLGNEWQKIMVPKITAAARTIAAKKHVFLFSRVAWICKVREL